MNQAIAETADVVIVGGGIEGAATAWALAQRGVTDVVLVERNTIGSGGTGKSSSVVRCHYGVPSLAAMAQVGVEFFENATEIVGNDVGFRQVGYVLGVDEPNLEILRANVANQRAVGVTVDIVDPDAVASMWPVADLDDFAAFAWEPRGGYGDAYMTAQAFATAARAAGVRVRQSARVVEILTDADRVSGVRLANGSTVSCGQVVVAAGPWSVDLLRPHGIDLPIQVHREQIVMVKPGTDLGNAPVFADLVKRQYIRTDTGGELLFGNNDMEKLEHADPDNYQNSASDALIDIAVEKISHRFPKLTDASISGSYAGCYDVTPDWNPVISATPVQGLTIAAGFSGHGFKIAPAVGKLTADLVTDGRSSDERIPESDFRLERFEQENFLRSPHPYIGGSQMR
jgi:glycine/D-amino acid oxidase-like deaminating enzyme